MDDHTLELLERAVAALEKIATTLESVWAKVQEEMAEADG